MQAFILCKGNKAFRTLLGGTPSFTAHLHEAKLFSTEKVAERFSFLYDLELDVKKVAVQ